MGKLEVSQRRIEANRRNALRSTGPKTAEGKEKSRRNSLIHGLAGAGVVVPEGETVAARERAEQWNSSLRPMNAFEVGLVETIAVESLRIERCRLEDNLVRALRARRAEHCWGDERKVAIARLARSLAKRPSETAHELSTSSPGCDWLIARWRVLGHVLDTNGEWTAEQTSLALDLLGIDTDLRSLPTPLDPPEGVNLLPHLQALVDDQYVRLLDRQDESLDPIEDELREAVMHGLNVTNDPTLVLLRRYETASFRRLRWALDLLHKGKFRPNAPGPDRRDLDRPAWEPTASNPGPGADRTHLGGPQFPVGPRFVDAMPPAGPFDEASEAVGCPDLAEIGGVGRGSSGLGRNPRPGAPSDRPRSPQKP
ncbi:hypothetical protein EP7_002245 [Isosphaeraceae bacterium EP7]